LTTAGSMRGDIPWTLEECWLGELAGGAPSGSHSNFWGAPRWYRSKAARPIRQPGMSEKRRRSKSEPSMNGKPRWKGTRTAPRLHHIDFGKTPEVGGRGDRGTSTSSIAAMEGETLIPRLHHVRLGKHRVWGGV